MRVLCGWGLRCHCVSRCFVLTTNVVVVSGQTRGYRPCTQECWTSRSPRRSTHSSTPPAGSRSVLFSCACACVMYICALCVWALLVTMGAGIFSLRPNPKWTQACKHVDNSFDVACIQSHLQQQVPFACVCTSRPVWIEPYKGVYGAGWGENSSSSPFALCWPLNWRCMTTRSVASLLSWTDPHPPLGKVPPSYLTIKCHSCLCLITWRCNKRLHLLQGQAFINGFNLGRYWPVVGPQVTLYVPRTVWNSQSSEQKLIMLELESAPCGTNAFNCTVTFQDQPSINAVTAGKKADAAKPASARARSGFRQPPQINSVK